MSDMLNIIAGRLETKPTLMPAFKGRFVMKNYLITEADEGDEREARVPIVAWDSVAEEILSYGKDDMIYLLCVPSDSLVQVQGNMIPVLGFKVIKVDHDRAIATKVNEKIIEILKSAQ
ncbi:hypothetical protein Ami103574_10745 [Aminipila butyrica]|uniref:Single-stranded DNA-binding protein n=1 Tax=Aminipila butyrica TaxID=433296 RepID=A0A858BVZ9_9FIRM|nr:hypothetical protein [Aminipila butyrica]QIB69767.1 hypothetical protein Ami103574_10745 [Aminipila butyrica]